MSIKISPALKRAFKRYYTNRTASRTGGPKWDKAADIKNIEANRSKNCVYLQACAGTFWLTWRRPNIQTTHDERNYWTGKVLARFRKGAWVDVRRRRIHR